MIKVSDIKVGNIIRFDGNCDEYNRKEYNGFLNCNLKVMRIKFYQQGIVYLKLTKTSGEEIDLPLDINTAGKWFTFGVNE